MGIRRTAWSFPANPVSAAEAQLAVSAHLARLLLPAGRRLSVSAALGEALRLAVGQPGLPEAPSVIRLAVDHDDHAVVLTLHDTGPGLVVPPSDDDLAAGLLVISAVTTSHELEADGRGGAELRMVFADAEEPASWSAAFEAGASATAELLAHLDAERERALHAVKQSEMLMAQYAGTSSALAATFHQLTAEAAERRALRRSARAVRAAERARRLAERLDDARRAA